MGKVIGGGTKVSDSSSADSCGGWLGLPSSLLVLLPLLLKSRCRLPSPLLGLLLRLLLLLKYRCILPSIPVAMPSKENQIDVIKSSVQLWRLVSVHELALENERRRLRQRLSFMIYQVFHCPLSFTNGAERPPLAEAPDVNGFDGMTLAEFAPRGQ